MLSGLVAPHAPGGSVCGAAGHGFETSFLDPHPFF